VSHVGHLLQRIAVACVALVGSLISVGMVQQPTTGNTKPVASDSGQDERDEPAPARQSVDRAKDDTGVDIESKLKAKKKKEERKPNFEIRTVRTSPSDTITFYKPNHWTLFQLDLIANNNDETIEVRTGYESLLDTPHAVHFRRLVHLQKEQNRLARLPVYLPERRKAKSLEVALYHPGGVLEIQPPGIDRQPCTLLGPDQFLIVALSNEPDNYRFLKDFQCILPGSEADDSEAADVRRYFYLVTQFQPTRPIVADTALAWSTTSAVIWDDLDPTLLSKRQQDALIDWLHFGGQLVVSGGSAATRLEQSFLAEYLPADVVGSSQASDLSELAARYPSARSIQHLQPQVRPIRILPGKPVYMARLAPRPEAEPVGPKDKFGDLPLVVERRVGRGRIVMAAFSLYQPELVQGWKDAYDTFWRERLLKIDETEPVAAFQPGGSQPRTYVRLPARKLSQFRFFARDLGNSMHRTRALAIDKSIDDSLGFVQRAMVPPGPDEQDHETVADWRDDTPVAQEARRTLLAATGIKIPPPDFVLTAAIAYLVALVPLNWLICRFVFRRPELSWLLTPVIILGFCIGIIYLARANVGYDSATQEINVVEMFGGYPRGHVSRFTCLYSGSRERCEFRYEDQGAVALPMSIGAVQRGHAIEQLSVDWEMGEGAPVAMGRYEVHPRSIGMIRAEEMRAFAGPFRLIPKAEPDEWTVENQSEWELWDCALVTSSGTIYVGDLHPGEKLDVSASSGPHRSPENETDSLYNNVHRVVAADESNAQRSRVSEMGDLSHSEMLELCEQMTQGLGLRAGQDRPRLVGWAPRAVPGQQIDPAQDRSVGFTVFVVHL
jgi:hypothetical protein